MQRLWYSFCLIMLVSCIGIVPVEKRPGASPSLSPSATSSPAAPTAKLGTFPIAAAPTSYHPAMSSTVGIGLTPAYTLGRSPDTVKYKWHTNYGHFVNWKAPQFQVIPLGADATTDATLEGTNVYWSYDSADAGKDKPVVQITLTVVDAQSNASLTAASLTVTWENQDTATVR